jgi:hypothetical protein
MRVGIYLLTVLCLVGLAQGRALEERPSVPRGLLDAPCETIHAGLKGAPVSCVLHAVDVVRVRMERRQQRWLEQHPAVGREWD